LYPIGTGDRIVTTTHGTIRVDQGKYIINEIDRIGTASSRDSGRIAKVVGVSSLVGASEQESGEASD
jgi:hypothetical protein